MKIFFLIIIILVQSKALENFYFFKTSFDFEVARFLLYYFEYIKYYKYNHLYNSIRQSKFKIFGVQFLEIRMCERIFDGKYKTDFLKKVWVQPHHCTHIYMAPASPHLIHCQGGMEILNEPTFDKICILMTKSEKVCLC